MMPNAQLFYLFAILLFSACSEPQATTESTARPPNIIYILADDLGYGELGCYGQQKIETPNIDALAQRGMKFTQHYTGAPVCAPARCILLTGQHAGHAYVRGNDEWKARGDVWDFAAMFADSTLEGQRPLPDSIQTLGELLQSAGYETALVGKWGLGAPTSEGTPNRQGFDFFYGYNCQRQAHTLYPTHLWRNAERDYLQNDLIAPHQTEIAEPERNDSAAYARFAQIDYAPEMMQREALQFVDQHHDEPFFLYYASPLPHLPLQAPRRWVEYYQQKFGEETPYTGKFYFPNQTPRATYAAMISYLDEQVGELVAKLTEHDLLDNTLIIFTSDNGPTYTGGADTPFFDSARPFKTEYGWGKGFTHEGGIRVPMIASWRGKITAGMETEHLSAFYDVLPTVCDLLQIETPTTDGISFLPTLLHQSQPEQHQFLYWEFPAYGGQQAVRMGKWKGIRKDILKGNVAIELYDLETDLQEQNNVAEQFSEIVEQIEKIMMQEHRVAETEQFRMQAIGD